MNLLLVFTWPLSSWSLALISMRLVWQETSALYVTEAGTQWENDSVGHIVSLDKHLLCVADSRNSGTHALCQRLAGCEKERGINFIEHKFIPTLHRQTASGHHAMS